MKLIFEKGAPGQHLTLLPSCDVPEVSLSHERTAPLELPHVSETELTRHYTALAKRVHGVNDGFYPLGSCTMKYNPRINEELSALPGFTGVHPTQSADTAQGCLEVLYLAEELLCEITGMDAMTFQPAAGAHGEFTALLMVKKYHLDRRNSRWPTGRTGKTAGCAGRIGDKPAPPPPRRRTPAGAGAKWPERAGSAGPPPGW